MPREQMLSAKNVILQEFQVHGRDEFDVRAGCIREGRRVCE